MLNLNKIENENLKIRILNWYNDVEDEDKKEIEDFLNRGNIKDIEESFLIDLEFGTGGIRGIMGIGPSKMNKYTVGKATQGVANYFLKKGIVDKKVVVSYDTRNNSQYFAKITAQIFSENGFKVYLFPEPAPTPCLSFAIRFFKTQIGVMITASHNPKDYNGYKLYDNTGCQITSPIDKEIIKEVNSITSLKNIKFGDFNRKLNYKKIEFIDKDYFYDSYIDEISKNLIDRDIFKNMNNFKIIYTSLHGTGIFPVKKIIDKLGIKNIFFVDEQVIPDGNFPTLKTPNPEEKESFLLGIKKAKEIDAQVIIATDPDADRIGIVFLEKDKNGNIKEFIPDGNEIGTILLYYLLNRSYILSNSYAINTIVTTDLHEMIANEKNVEFYRVLTGFKYIGEIINKNENRNFIFGGEESYGYLIGKHARDKDAIVIMLIFIELSYNLFKNNIPPSDYLKNIYKKYGYYRNSVYSLNLSGIEGLNKIKEIMENLRTKKYNFFETLCIKKTIDYKFEETGLPKSDVLQFFGENFKITVRPSGTEPKIKIYLQVNGDNEDYLLKKIEEISEILFKELK